MQARLAMIALDAAAASPKGAKPASGKKGDEGAFAGMLLTSGALVAHVEHAAVPPEGSAKGSAMEPEAGDPDQTGSGATEATPAIPAGLVPWKAVVANPDAGNSVDPAQTSPDGPAVAVGEAPSQPDTGDPAPKTVEAGDGFAGTGNPAVDVEAAGSAPSVAIEEPLPNPAAEESAEQIVQATVPEAAVVDLAGTSTVGRQEGAGEEAAPAGARPLEVADVLELKARQLRHQATGGETGKPTYGDPRLFRDPARQGGLKPVRPEVADAVKAAPLETHRAATLKTAEAKGVRIPQVLAAPVKEAVTAPRDMPDVAATQKTAEAKGARIPQVPAASVNESGMEATEVADSKEAAAKPEETTSVQEAVRHPEDSVKTDTSTAKATPAASLQAEDISGQAEALHSEQSATEMQPGDKAGSDATIGATRSSGVHDRTAARNADPVFRQVVENLDLQHTGSKVRIQLNPEHLGRLEVALTDRDNTLEVRIVADNPQAAQALEGNIRDLTDGLKAKAGHFQHLDVHVEVRETVRVKPEDGQPDRRDQQQRGQERQAGDGRQNDSRERGRRQNRPGAGNEQRTWSWTGAEEESP